MTMVCVPLLILGQLLEEPATNFQPRFKRKSGREISVFSLLKSTFIIEYQCFMYYKDTKNYPVLQLYSSIIIIQNYDLLRNCCKPEFAYFTGTSFRIYVFAFIKNSFPIFGYLHSYTCFSFECTMPCAAISLTFPSVT